MDNKSWVRSGVVATGGVVLDAGEGTEAEVTRSRAIVLVYAVVEDKELRTLKQDSPSGIQNVQVLPPHECHL
jgi:hypothetical protein